MAAYPNKEVSGTNNGNVISICIINGSTDTRTSSKKGEMTVNDEKLKLNNNHTYVQGVP